MYGAPGLGQGQLGLERMLDRPWPRPMAVAGALCGSLPFCVGQRRSISGCDVMLPFQSDGSTTTESGVRDRFLAVGKLAESGDADLYVCMENMAFSSPSASAAVVNAGNMNGRAAWKVTGTGETYQDWYAKKLAAAGAFSNSEE